VYIQIIRYSGVLHRTLGLIGFIWIFLVGSSMDCPTLNFRYPVFLCILHQEPATVSYSESASKIHIVKITWVTVNECINRYPRRKFPVKLLHRSSWEIIWRNFPVFVYQALSLFMTLQRRKHLKSHEWTRSKTKWGDFVYSIIWFIITKLFGDFYQIF